MRILLAISQRLLTASAIVAALQLVAPVRAQYPQTGYGQPTTPQYGQAGVYQGYAPGGAGYVDPYSVPRVAMGYQQPATTIPSNDAPALTAPAEQITPALPQNDYIPQSAPANQYGSPSADYGQGGAGAANGQNGGYGGPNFTTYGGCDATAYGSCNTSCDTCGPMGNVLRSGAGCNYWFGGVYGLFMDRDNSNKYTLAYVTDPSMPTAYPPAGMDVVLNTRDVDVGFQPGVEFRLGRTFGAGYDPCSCCTTGPRWGVEGVYWILFDDDESTQYVNPTGTSRTYTTMPMYGLEYDHGTGYLPVNQYWDHGMPSDPANPVRVTTVRQRSSFEAQNLEINMLRLGICGGGCGPASFTAGYGPAACGGACAPRASRYSCTAVCGFRWMQFDEDFMFGVDYLNPAWGTPAGYLNYWSQVENNLIGAQIGCNGMYRIGCKWGLHLDTLVGLYGNDIDVDQYMVSPTGLVRYMGTQEAFDVSASKTDVAVLSELRLGASYQATCHCRLYGGWRLMGVSGIALATDQTPNAFLSSAQMSNYVNSNGSMILHGLQAGIEWNY